MNRWLKAFRVVVFLGILVNLGFILPALIAPDTLMTWLSLHPNAAAFPWLGNAAVLLIQVSAFYVLVALAPPRYPAFAWTGVVLRLFVSLFWLHTSRAPGQGAFFGFFVTDCALALVQGVLLQFGLPAEAKIDAAGMKRLGTGLVAIPKWFARSRRAQVVTAFAVVILGVSGYWLWANLLRMQPDASFSDPAMQFKYGAIGLGFQSRIPYELFKVLPDVCPDKLPGGYASLGLITEPGQATPVGFSQRNIGFASIEPNCALCHTSSVRTGPGGAALLLLGAPAHTLDLQKFQHFLFSCAQDPRFTVSNVLSRIEKQTKLNFGQKLAYRLIILPLAKQGLLTQARAYAWQDSRPTQGAGRTDTFNPTKFNVFHLPEDHTIGTVDFPAIWNQGPKGGLYLHWDGNNNALKERNYAAAMAVGATAHSVIVKNFNTVTNFLLTLPPPAFPFPIDQAAAGRGQALWADNCASCHAFGAQQVGQVTPVEVIGTDPNRLNSFTTPLLAGFHAINDPPLVFDAYRKTNGYANAPLDGIWARAPYLHNGSVPTLWDLLQPAANRPKVFFTGSQSYDPQNLGFVSSSTGEATQFVFDTTQPGNANAGHTYGTGLTDPQKRDLLEYMKTL